MLFEVFNGFFHYPTQDASNEEHALFSPSSASFWLKCNGYATIEDTRPTSEKALEGRKAHDFELKNFIKFTKGQGEHEKTPYLEFIKSYLPKKGFLFFEHRLNSGNKDFFGTIDLAIMDDKTKTLLLCDLKTGKNKVKPDYNEQLACYNYLIQELYPLIGEPKRVIYSIYQEGAFLWEREDNWYNSITKEIEKVINKKKLEFNPTAACHSCFKNTMCSYYGAKVKTEIKPLEAGKSLSLLREQELVDLWSQAQVIKKYTKAIENELKLREDKLTLISRQKLREVSIWKNKKEALQLDKFVEPQLIPLSQAKKDMTEAEKDKFIGKRIDKTWRINDNTELK